MRNPWLRQVWIAPLLIALAIALSCLWLPFAGGFHDDGVYLTSAKALAGGKGYVIESLPDEIPQTKYPILFPALLAVAWALWPSFPDNLPLLRLVPLLAGAGWTCVLWRLIGAKWKRRENAHWVLALTMTAPLIFYVSVMPLSETLFALLGATAILRFCKAVHEPRGQGIRNAAAAAIVCAAAFYTRTIGISLLVCAVVAFPPWRRPKQLLAFALVWIALCTPWWIWQAAHDAPSNPALAYYSKDNYSGWNGLSGTEAPGPWDVAQSNVIRILGSGLTFWNLPGNAATVSLCLLFAVMAVAGLIVQLRRRESLGAVWALATVAIVLLWPWPPQRFLVPVLPFAILAVADAVPGRLRERMKTPGRAIAAAVIAWGLFMSGSFAVESRAAGEVRGPLNNGDLTWKDRKEAYNWIATMTSSDAIVAGNPDPNYWLYGARKGFRAFAADPGKLFYAPDSPAGALGPPEQLVRLLQAMEADYLVLERSSLFQETAPFEQQIRDVRKRHPLFLPVAFECGSGRITIYRVVWEGIDGRKLTAAR